MPKFDAFFSYAREDFSPYMGRFFVDLDEEIRLLLGRARGDNTVFRDEQNIDIGKPWRPEIVNALQSTQVLISVHTPRYFTRAYCGKEVGVVLARQARLRTTEGRISAVIPIEWCPCGSVPATVLLYQQTHAALPAAYRENGLLVLTRNKKFEGEYFDCVRFFARRIADAVQQSPPLPSLALSPGLDEVSDAFQTYASEGSSALPAPQSLGPRLTRFCYAVGTRSHLRNHKLDCSRYDEERGEFWQPFVNAQAIGVLAGRTATAHAFVPDLLPADTNFISELETARDKNNLVVVIVDTWTLDKCAEIQATMETCDSRPSTHCAVIVVWNEADPETDQSRKQLENRVALTFPILSTREPPYFKPSVASASEFDAVLADTLRRLQAKVIGYGLRKRSITSGASRPIPILHIPHERVADG